MTIHNIRVVQTFRVVREIVVSADAPDIQAAIDMQSETDAPAFDDPRWRSSWTLENELIEMASEKREEEG